MKRETLIVFTITFMLLAPLSSLGIFGLSGTHTLQEQEYIISDTNWLGDYQFRKSHTITGSIGAETNYQVLINVTRATGSDTGNNVFVGTNCQTDFDDIRFTDNDKTTELDYWNETSTSEYALFWVEVSDDLDTNQVIYIYYGDDAVSTTGNGDETFLFYEDWSSSTVRGAEWNTIYNDGSITFHYVLDGADSLYGEDAHGLIIAEIDGGVGTDSQVYESTLERSAPFSMMFRALIEETVASDQRIRIGSSSPMAHPIVYIDTNAGSNNMAITDDNGNADAQALADSVFDVYHTFELTRDGTSAELYVDGVLEETGSCAPDTVSDTAVYIFVADTEYDLYSDWIAVRKFLATEPSHSSWGTEEEDSRQWHSFTMEPIEFDLPGWNVFTMEDISFYVAFGELNISYLLMLGGLVMIPTSTVLLVKGGRSDMSRDKLFLFLIMHLFGWALVLGGIL